MFGHKTCPFSIQTRADTSRGKLQQHLLQPCGVPTVHVLCGGSSCWWSRPGVAAQLSHYRHRSLRQQRLRHQWVRWLSSPPPCHRSLSPLAWPLVSLLCSLSPKSSLAGASKMQAHLSSPLPTRKNQNSWTKLVSQTSENGTKIGVSKSILQGRQGSK